MKLTAKMVSVCEKCRFIIFITIMLISLTKKTNQGLTETNRAN